jgi:hypothetical protein
MVLLLEQAVTAMGKLTPSALGPGHKQRMGEEGGKQGHKQRLGKVVLETIAPVITLNGRPIGGLCANYREMHIRDMLKLH